jgi:stage II sporulation protein R
LAAIILMAVCALEFVGLCRDKMCLREDLIRLHVVAASDSEEDQSVKLCVRDAVVDFVETAMSHVMTAEEAKAWLQEHIPQIQKAANDALDALGLPYDAQVTMQQEAFPKRDYTTFSLPAGVYASLRVTLGEGEGKNWWCVVFPTLCLPAAGEDTESVAVDAGFSEPLTDTLTGKEGFRLRFYFLDVLGRVENFFFGL